MYSYGDRIRAAERYIKLGKRIRATIRRLGYPTKNALKGWYWEFEQRLDLPVGYHRDPRGYVMPLVALIVEALGGVVGTVVAVVGSMGTVRVLLLSWRLIRAIRDARS